MSRFDLSRIALVLLLCSGLAKSAAAQEEEEAKELGWADVAELALVTTGGNSEVSTLGFRNLLTRVWENAGLQVEVAGLRTETKKLDTRVSVALVMNF